MRWLIPVELVYTSLSLQVVVFLFFLSSFHQSTEGSKKGKRRKIISSFFFLFNTSKARGRKKPSMQVYRPWVVLVLLLDYIFGRMRMNTEPGSHPQPTLIMLGNFEKNTDKNSSLDASRRLKCTGKRDKAKRKRQKTSTRMTSLLPWKT